MRYSDLFAKTSKGDPRDEVSTNAKLLTKAGFIDKLMAGSFTLLPLGFKVVKKIEAVIREEINKTGAQEILMPLLHSKSIWNETGRWETAKEVMYQLKKANREYALSFTHEEIVLDLVRKHTSSYRDYPIKLYHFSTKFRDELRAKSGILRGREFLMKDLYSLHLTKENFEKYYWQVAEAYKRIFKKLGLEVIVTEAGGGVFTKNTTHEFQVLSETGEDEIIYCEGGDFSQNVEIAKVKEGKACDKGHGPLKKAKAIEVGNIFSFGQEYCKKMNVTFTDEKGKAQYPYFGSYGIGLTRTMGAIVEVLHDDKGIIWPKSVAPFDIHLVHVEDPGTESNAKRVYGKLKEVGIEVLWDDREDASAGQKFADADLIGIPVRLVVSAKTKDKVEFKKRDSQSFEILSLIEVLNRLKKV